MQNEPKNMPKTARGTAIQMFADDDSDEIMGMIKEAETGAEKRAMKSDSSNSSIEEMITDCEVDLRELQNTNFVFRDKERKVREIEFKPQESIFFRKDGITELNKRSNCKSCRLEFQSERQMVLCTFCGMSACKDCSQKSRYYQASALDDNKRRVARGVICRMCDRKFFVRNMINK
jgi:hypothetical protein